MSAPEESIDQETPIWQRPINRLMIAHRVVQLGILLTLVWKWGYFVDSSDIYEAIPLHDTFFPTWLQSIWVLRISFLGTVIALAVNLFVGDRWFQKACCLLTLIGTSILCLHQCSYNDMTFVTAWWASLWAFWFVLRIDIDDEDHLLRRSAFLSRLIISMILLGGGMGKWTAEYWSGEVFYDIYFLDRDFWVFNYLRENFEAEQLRTMSMWYSRKVVVLETVAGLTLWLLPPKWAAATAVTILMGIALLSNFLLFSVLNALIGLALVGFLVQKKGTTNQTNRTNS